MTSTPADRLREARQRAGFASATDAARGFKWKFSTYLGHENGSRGLRVAAAKDYANAFRVSATWLLDGDEGAGQVGVPVVAKRDLDVLRPSEYFTLSEVIPEGTKYLPVGVDGYRSTELFAIEIDDGRTDDLGALYLIFVSASLEEAAVFSGDDIIVKTFHPTERGEYAELNVWRRKGDMTFTTAYEQVPRESDAVLKRGGASEIWGVVVAEYRVRVRSITDMVDAQLRGELRETR